MIDEKIIKNVVFLVMATLVVYSQQSNHNFDYLVYGQETMNGIELNEIIAREYHSHLLNTSIVNDIDFAGDYFNNGEYSIAIKSKMDEYEDQVVIEKYSELLLNQGNDLFLGFDNFVFVDFSLFELQQLQDTIDEVMVDFLIDSTSIDIASNSISVKVEDAAYFWSLNDYLSQTTNSSDLPIKLVLDSNFQTKLTSSAYSGQKIRELWWFVELGYGSIGFNAYQESTNLYGLVTNAHVAKVGIEYKDNSGAVIGTRTSFEFGGTVDAAFVPFSNQNNWTPTNVVKIQGQNAIAKYITHTSIPLLGTSVVKFGATTGQKYGQITSVSTTIIIEGITFTDVMEFNLPVGPGDSGGPIGYYYTKSMNIGLLGITFAGNQSTNTTFGIKIANIENSLGVQVVTR